MVVTRLRWECTVRLLLDWHRGSTGAEDEVWQGWERQCLIPNFWKKTRDKPARCGLIVLSRQTRYTSRILQYFIVEFHLNRCAEVVSNQRGRSWGLNSHQGSNSVLDVCLPILGASVAKAHSRCSSPLALSDSQFYLIASCYVDCHPGMI